MNLLHQLVLNVRETDMGGLLTLRFFFSLSCLMFEGLHHFFIQYQPNVDFKATEELGLGGEFCQAGKCLSTGIKYSELQSW